MEQDTLAIHLNNLQRDDCYRVDKLLKQSEHETTQVVYFVGSNGAEQGPYIRKYLSLELGLGSVYEALYEAYRSGKRLRHIPIVFDCFQAGESLVVIMEYVAGETLQDVVYQKDPSVEFALDVFPKICDAILELHEEFFIPIIHRDLKPSNIMLSQNNLTLIDFGISRLYNREASQDTYHFGTKSYAPPEQFGFGQTDMRSDVYSLGMLLYYCLTEQTPTAQARDAGFYDQRIPELLREVLVKASALDPKQRYTNVREMKDAFLRVSACIRPSFAPQPVVQTSSFMPQPSVQTFEPNIVAGGSGFGATFNQPSSLAPQLAAQAFEPKGAGGSETIYIPPSSFAPLPTSSQSSIGAVEPVSRAEIGSNQKRRLPRILSRIPRIVGTIWNIAVLLVFLLFLISSCALVIDPSPNYEHFPLYGRALLYASLLFLFIGPIVFLLLDKRMLARPFPGLAQLSLLKHAAITLAAVALGLVAIGFFATIWS